MEGYELMRQIFQDATHDGHFREFGYVVTDLLDHRAVGELWSFYADSFPAKRAVVPYAEKLPYYISIFDKDSNHKREVDARISDYVTAGLEDLMLDYEVFYSNFMIKFPGDGQIEAHQDFNFVDESLYTAFNLWCPLIDTDIRNGGLFVIPGSHNVFRTQRGPNLPKALTEYNDLLRRYARWVPLQAGQAIIFDHKLIHYSPPNRTSQVRVAVQSVLKPREAAAVHYIFDEPSGKVKAYRIDKAFVLENNLWDSDLSKKALDHEQDLIPLLRQDEMVRKLAYLTCRSGARTAAQYRSVFHGESVQRAFDQDGYVKLSVLGDEEVRQLKDLFVESTGGAVANSEYGMYISLEEKDLARKQALIQRISGIVLPYVNPHFRDCKPHLGSFLVKAPGEKSYTYPHQDWTFVESPPFVSITVWIALVDTDEGNGALGFVKGSQRFFDQPIGSPSPPFGTCTQGHEALLYEYLEFVPLKAGQAVAFDNRTIHGATPNRTAAPRLAVAIGMTPSEAQMYHYFLVPESVAKGRRTLAKLRVAPDFFERYSVSGSKALFDRGQMPGDCEVAATLEHYLAPYSAEEIRELCEQAGSRQNGKRLIHEDAAGHAIRTARPAGRVASFVGSVWKAIAGS